jgi:putative copper export protein/mono/diheme cytochrome c family protein
MLDPLSLARGAANLAGAIVIGAGFLLWFMRDAVSTAGGACWRRRVAVLLIAAAGLGLLAAALFTNGTAAGAASIGPFSFATAVLHKFLTKTWAGSVALFQLVFAAAALILSFLAWATVKKAPTSDGLFLSAALAAGLSLSAVAFASHPTSIEPETIGIFAAIAHRLALSLWLGGLPALLLLIGVGPLPDDTRRLAAIVLRRFSHIATVAMLVIVVSGSLLTWYLVRNFSSAIGTSYGHLLIIKLLLLGGVLLIANSLQRSLLPALEMKPSDSTILSYAKRVKVETVLAFLIVIVASIMAQANPPEHEDIYWPLPFRFSLVSTWGTPWVSTYVIGGGALTLLGLVLVASWWRPSLRVAGLRVAKLSPRSTLAIGIAATAVGAGLALPAISVQAYPDTFLTTEITYSTQSVGHGLSLFEQNCTPCHGVSGLGNGPMARSLPRAPADFSAPHTALHTGGDLYWWVTHGILPSGMPAFGDALSNDDRWDIINWLGAFSVGYQARVIDPTVAPGQSWLAPPDFLVTDPEGHSKLLSEYRRESALLLVFSPGDARDKARMEQLLAARERLAELGAQIILITPSKTGRALRDLATNKTLLVNSDADDAIATYGLFTRTFGDAKVDVARAPVEHAEFLIDRSGYIRARWLPAEDNGPDSWSDLAVLERQLEVIAKEPLKRPPLGVHEQH